MSVSTINTLSELFDQLQNQGFDLNAPMSRSGLQQADQLSARGVTTYTGKLSISNGTSKAPSNNEPQGESVSKYKFEIGDMVIDKDGVTGVVVAQTMNSEGAGRPGYTVLREDGVKNNGKPVGYNYPVEYLTLATRAGIGRVSFDSVILSDHKKQQIVDAISQVDNHSLIFEKWGFNEVFEKGTAISLLFYGPPGTGKTLMGQAIADKFGYKLQIVSTAEIETPEPGGAERNLKKYFTEAQEKKTVLLFDECDGLITDRSRVGMILAAQINALLTELEKFTGIAIFTTNRLEALDPAFDRRLSLKLEFPMPDAKHRVLIWKRMFPSKAPLAKDIRWEDLGKIEIAGGHIKNVVLKAARKAAHRGEKKITDEIIWECLEQEVESLEDYKDALDSNKQWYGQALPHQGQGLVRERGKRSIG